MDRRTFNRRALTGALALPLLPSCFPTDGEKQALEGMGHYFSAVQASKTGIVPNGKAIPFGWDYFTIAPESPVRLTWEALPTESVTSAWLRIASATDIRPGCKVAAVLAQSGEVLGTFDVRFGYMCQLFEIEVDIKWLPDIQQEGIRLEMTEGEGDIWWFQKGKATPEEAALLTPHLLLVEKPTPEKHWQERLLSYNSIQFFGWAEGVTLDGIHTLGTLIGKEQARTWFENHLGLFFNEEEKLVYTGIRNEVKIQKVESIETVLPFAVLATYRPEHPAIPAIIEFCETHANADGVIADGDPNSPNRYISTESNYTISYPLSVIAQQFDRDDLFGLAANSILGRKQHLTDEEGIYQRGREGGEKMFKNWGRGVAWYVLGMARTLELLPNSMPEKAGIEAELKRAFQFIAPFQQEDGLFPVFLHEPETGTETSGAAGIAAAIAVAEKLGLADEQARAMLARIKQGLAPHFTPDGFLKNVVQHNAGGRELQANGYRTISQYALGFYAIIERYGG